MSWTPASCRCVGRQPIGQGRAEGRRLVDPEGDLRVSSGSPPDAFAPLCADHRSMFRDDELRWLTAALRTTERGAGTLVAVEGAAGTGRTHFVQEARRRA